MESTPVLEFKDTQLGGEDVESEIKECEIPVFPLSDQVRSKVTDFWVHEDIVPRSCVSSFIYLSELFSKASYINLNVVKIIKLFDSLKKFFCNWFLIANYI